MAENNALPSRPSVTEFLDRLPAWFIKDEPVSDLDGLVRAAARKAFLYERYLEVRDKESQYFGQLALQLLQRGELPRWVDQRRFMVQYTHFRKESWVKLWGILFGPQLARLFSQCREIDGPILDLACGCGWLSLELARLGKEAVGVDVSESSIAVARYFFEHRDLDTDEFLPDFYGQKLVPLSTPGSARYETQDLNSLALPERSFSAAVAWEALHHIHNLEGVVEQVQHALKPDGVFIVHETINEPVSGQKLVQLMTAGPILRFVAAWHARHKRREPELSQQAFVEELKRSFKAPDVGPPVLWSPFERVSGTNMLDLFQKYFTVVHRSFYHHFLTEDAAFKIIQAWTDRMGFAPSLGFATMVFGGLKWIDDLAVRPGGLRPVHAYLVLKPRPWSTKIPLTVKDRAGELAKRPLSDADRKSALSQSLRKVLDVEPSSAEAWDALEAFSLSELIKGRLAPADEAARLLLISGWHLVEGDLRWTDGCGRMYFCFPKDARSLEIEMMGKPMASRKNPQNVTLAVGEAPLAEIAIIEPGWHKYSVPLGDVPRDVIELSIKSSVMVPKDLGMSEDWRSLGVAVRYVLARPA